MGVKTTEKNKKVNWKPVLILVIVFVLLPQVRATIKDIATGDYQAAAARVFMNVIRVIAVLGGWYIADRHIKKQKKRKK